MPRGPGRDKKVAATRQLALLTRLAQAMPGWVNRDELAAALFPGRKSARDSIARDRRELEGVGWTIEQRGEGEHMQWRLVGKDPRLATSLSGPQRHELGRAVRISGRDPAEFGFDRGPATSPAAPIDDALRAALHLEEFLHALQHRCAVSLTYHGRARLLCLDDVRRTGTGRWRITAHEMSRQLGALGPQKQFRLDRCEDVRLGPPGTAPPPQPVSQDSDPLSFVDGDPVTAVVLVQPEHEAKVVRDLGKPSERDEDDAGIRLHIPVTNRWLWRMRLYQLGTRVRLLGPPDLADEVRTELRLFAGES